MNKQGKRIYAIILFVIITVMIFLVAKLVFNILATPIYFFLLYKLHRYIVSFVGEVTAYFMVLVFTILNLIYFIFLWNQLYIYINVLAYALISSIVVLFLTIPIQNWDKLNTMWHAKSGVLLIRKITLLIVLIGYLIVIIVLGYLIHFTGLIPT